MTKEKSYAFIDTSNIIYGARAEGWFIDQKKLLQYLKRKYTVSKAFFYYGKDSKSEEKEKFLRKLKSFGYTLRVKEIKRYGKKSKANCDVDLTMDMLLMMKEYKKAIVLTGDGDFTPLLAYLISKRKHLTVIASPKRTAREIKSLLGGNFQSFDDLKNILEYKKRGRPQSSTFPQCYGSILAKMKKYINYIKPLLIFLLTVSFLSHSISPVFAATFTPNMAKRDAPGPFAAGVVSQGQADGDGTGDDIWASSGSTIKDYWTSNMDQNQGSISL